MMLKGIMTKKLLVTILTAIGVIVNDAMGSPVSMDAIYTVVAAIAVYVFGQGIADHGQQGKAKAAERAAKQGGVVSAAVQGALGAAQPVIHDDDDEGTEWVEAVIDRTESDDNEEDK